MRTIGVAERALALLCKRAQSRIAFGQKLSEMGSVRQDIAKSRMEIDQARLLTMHAARRMDQVGNKEARTEIAFALATAFPRHRHGLRPHGDVCTPAGSTCSHTLCFGSDF
jgi:acyl-CoA dehydrogenase